MSGEIDLSGEQDPTERMVEQQQQAQERAEDEENHRDADHEGSVQTDEFDLDDALSVISSDHSTADDVTSESSEEAL